MYWNPNIKEEIGTQIGLAMGYIAKKEDQVRDFLDKVEVIVKIDDEVTTDGKKYYKEIEDYTYKEEDAHHVSWVMPLLLDSGQHTWKVTLNLTGECNDGFGTHYDLGIIAEFEGTIMLS